MLTVRSDCCYRSARTKNQHVAVAQPSTTNPSARNSPVATRSARPDRPNGIDNGRAGGSASCGSGRVDASIRDGVGHPTRVVPPSRLILFFATNTMAAPASECRPHAQSAFRDCAANRPERADHPRRSDGSVPGLMGRGKRRAEERRSPREETNAASPMARRL